MFTLFLLIYNFYISPQNLMINPYTSINTLLVKWGSNDEPVIKQIETTLENDVYHIGNNYKEWGRSRSEKNNYCIVFFISIGWVFNR